MSMNDSESEADIASTSTSDNVLALDDHADNASDVEKITLSQRKAVKVLKTTWEVCWSRPWWRRSEGKMVWSHPLRQ